MTEARASQAPAAADVRVYLFTYRRDHLLPRALNSLLAQTHTNWVCELHNDDPANPFPGQLVAQIADPRVNYVHHSRNLGPTKTFDLAFRPIAEPFVSLLEDDNWWEPELLARLLSAIRQQPRATVAWANAWLWRESNTGEWERLQPIWPVADGPALTLFDKAEPRQACRAIHSNTAMLLSVGDDTMFPSPEGMPFFAIEPIRERRYGRPLLLVREPLANFAITLESSRDETADQNMQVQALLAQTFLAGSNFSDAFHRQMWDAAGGSRGHTHRALIVAAILARRFMRVLKSARPADLALVAGWAIRHPVRFARLFTAGRTFPHVLAFLVRAAAGRHAQS